MLVATPVVTDVRVMREATALAESGHQVRVVGRDIPFGREGGPGVQLLSAPGGAGLRGRRKHRTGRGSYLWRTARWLLLPEHRRRTFGRWAREAERQARGLEFDVVHAHDYTALALGDRLARDRGVPLIYDAHELWSERHRSGRPTPVADWWQRAREQRLGTRAAVVLTVGEALAERLHEVYRWPHVVVVRNTFPVAADSATALPSRPVAAVYAGRLAPGRDLETVAAASSSVDLAIRLVGPSDPEWIAGFVPYRSHVDPAVAADEVDALLRASGLALVTLADGWGNHRVALPNKLFQAVSAGVPVVASDIGELARIVREHGVGVLYRPGDVKSLVAALDEAVLRFTQLRQAVQEAHSALSWSADRDTLLDVYRGLESAR
jgi:glycogen(starch) synthase